MGLLDLVYRDRCTRCRSQLTDCKRPSRCAALGLENYTAVEEQNIEYVDTPVQLGGVDATTAWVGIQQTLALVHEVRVSSRSADTPRCGQGLQTHVANTDLSWTRGFLLNLTEHRCTTLQNAQFSVLNTQCATQSGSRTVVYGISGSGS